MLKMHLARFFCAKILYFCAVLCYNNKVENNVVYEAAVPRKDNLPVFIAGKWDYNFDQRRFKKCSHHRPR